MALGGRPGRGEWPKAAGGTRRRHCDRSRGHAGVCTGRAASGAAEGPRASERRPGRRGVEPRAPGTGLSLPGRGKRPAHPAPGPGGAPGPRAVGRGEQAYPGRRFPARLLSGRLGICLRADCLREAARRLDRSPLPLPRGPGGGAGRTPSPALRAAGAVRPAVPPSCPSQFPIPGLRLGARTLAPAPAPAPFPPSAASLGAAPGWRRGHAGVGAPAFELGPCEPRRLPVGEVFRG